MSATGKNQIRKRPGHESAGSYSNMMPSIAPNTRSQGPIKKKVTYDMLPKRIGGKRLFITLCGLLVASLFLRFYKIWNGAFVVWDEAHFGKFASYYIRREFYTDVHPPLGKMLSGLSGILAGYNGKFPFESGSSYPPDLSYDTMRIVHGMFGSLIVPLGYLTATELGLSIESSFLYAGMLLFENGLISISRLILLDSFLIAFTHLTVYAFAALRRRRELSIQWLMFLALTGVSLGLVSSVKWVGLFTMAFVGVFTLYDLFQLLPMLKNKKERFALGFLLRVLFLIAVPLFIYVAVFKMHFYILNSSGPGDGQMSSVFQANQRGNLLSEYPSKIAYGSKVTIRSGERNGALLHSHIQVYPGGSKQQQVTTYGHHDHNNTWIIVPVESEMQGFNLTFYDEQLDVIEAKRHGSTLIDENIDETKNSEDFDAQTLGNHRVRYVRNGEAIRLFHTSTKKYLKSNGITAFFDYRYNEVSCWDQEENPKNSHWIIDSHDGLDTEEGTGLGLFRTLTTRFRLVHKETGNVLRYTSESLPAWGFQQGKVVCSSPSRHGKKDRGNLWNFERNINVYLSRENRRLPASSFFQDFIDVNVGMWVGNNSLVPNPELIPQIITSLPIHWPFLKTGLRMGSWEDNAHKFYMFGNPVVWYLSTLAIALACLYVGGNALYSRRVLKWPATPIPFGRALWLGRYMFSGLCWMLHYFPFFLMGRVTYLHHYYPAYMYSILTLAVLVDHVLDGRSTQFRRIAMAAIGVCVLTSFIFFKNLTYGFEGPSSNYASLRWIPTWNIVR